MNCKNCGNLLEQDSRFCTTCGAVVESPSVTSPIHEPKIGRQSQTNTRQWMLVAIATIYMLSVTCFLSYSVYNKYASKKPKKIEVVSKQTPIKPEKLEQKKEVQSTTKPSSTVVLGTYSNPAGSWVFTLAPNGVVLDKESKKIGSWRIDKDLVVLTYSFDNIINYITFNDIVTGKPMINVRNNKKWKGQIHKVK